MQSSACIACLIMLMQTIRLLRDENSFTYGSTSGHVRSKKQGLVPNCLLWGMRLLLTGGLDTEPADSKYFEFPLMLLGIQAARKSWLSPRPPAWGLSWCHWGMQRAGTQLLLQCRSADNIGASQVAAGREVSSALDIWHFSWIAGCGYQVKLPWIFCFQIYLYMALDLMQVHMHTARQDIYNVCHCDI